jgi:hypothetical protein
LQNSPEAFIPLTLSDPSLTIGGKTENGTLSLNYVTLRNPEATTKQQRDVLRVNTVTESPLDPARIITSTVTPAFRSYTFAATKLEATEILLRVKAPGQINGINTDVAEKLDTFESILEQYAIDFHRQSSGSPVTRTSLIPHPRRQCPHLAFSDGRKTFEVIS